MDAGPTRAYLAWLSAHGVGCTHVAKLAGVDRRVVQLLAAGTTKSVSLRVAGAILSVHAVLALGVHVNAVGTRRYMRLLLAEGYSKADLAHFLGLRARKLDRHIGDVTRDTDADPAAKPRQVTLRTALKIKRLYHQLTRIDGDA